MENNGQTRFTSITGFKRAVYLPRQGKIALGIKKTSAKGNTYPAEVDYFVVPPEVAKVYGDKPKVLDIMFPTENPADCIPFCYKKYSSNNKIQCRGNGEIALRFNQTTKEPEQCVCPCPDKEPNEKGVKKCLQRGSLMVILPRVSLGGVYQIDTGSTVNINRALDAMDYWQKMVGRCKGIMLQLERVAEKVSNPDGQMNTHYLFRFTSNINIDIANKAIENRDKFMQLEYKVEKPAEELDNEPAAIVEGELAEDPAKPQVTLPAEPVAPATAPAPADPEIPFGDPVEDQKKSDCLDIIRQLIIKKCGVGNDKTVMHKKVELLKEYFGVDSWAAIQTLSLVDLQAGKKALDK